MTLKWNPAELGVAEITQEEAENAIKDVSKVLNELKEPQLSDTDQYVLTRNLLTLADFVTGIENEQSYFFGGLDYVKPLLQQIWEQEDTQMYSFYLSSMKNVRLNLMLESSRQENGNKIKIDFSIDTQKTDQYGQALEQESPEKIKEAEDRLEILRKSLGLDKQ